jgi:hypothetical protein
LDALGFRTSYAANELTIGWGNPFPAVDKNAEFTALNAKQITREALERNLNDVIELVNKDIEAAASHGNFVVDFYSLSIYSNNMQSIIDALQREGYTASHSGSYLHISWEA